MWASRVLVLIDLGVADFGVGGQNHGVDQVNGLDDVAQLHFARFHRSAGDKDHGISAAARPSAFRA